MIENEDFEVEYYTVRRFTEVTVALLFIILFVTL